MTGRWPPMVDQWQSGRKGRDLLMAAIEEPLQSPELVDFLTGLDSTPEDPEQLSSKGFWVTVSRLLCLTVPTKRCR